MWRVFIIVVMIIGVVSAIAFVSLSSFEYKRDISDTREYERSKNIDNLKTNCEASAADVTQFVTECRNIILDRTTKCITFTTRSECIINYTKDVILRGRLSGRELCGLRVNWEAKFRNDGDNRHTFRWCKV